MTYRQCFHEALRKCGLTDAEAAAIQAVASEDAGVMAVVDLDKVYVGPDDDGALTNGWAQIKQIAAGDAWRDRLANPDRLKERLAPGIWTDFDGAIHISIPELLEHFGYADNEVNRKKMSEIADAFLRKASPDSSVIHRP